MIVSFTPGLPAFNGVQANGSGVVRNRVLLAENLPRPRQNTALLLRQSGYVVHEATTAAAALDLLGRRAVDVVLLSLELPDRGGLDLLAEAVRVARGVPVIVCTFSYNVHYGVDAMKCGARDYLTKPLDEKKVLEAVAAALEPGPSPAPVVDREEFSRQLHLQRRAVLYELARAILHGLGNRLSVVCGLAEMFVDTTEPTHPLYSHLVQLQASAQEAARDVEKLQTLDMPTPQRGDLNVVVQRLRPLLEPVLRKEVELFVVAEPALGYTQADVAHMDQVLVNFVLNARAAIRQSGQVDIRTANIDLAEERNGVPPGAYVVFSVRDDGRGMTEEVQVRMCDSYFSTRPPRQAAGLGLTMAAAVIRRAGGYLVCDSRLGQGTEFVVYLPRLDADPTFIARATGPGVQASPPDSPDNNANGGTISDSLPT